MQRCPYRMQKLQDACNTSLHLRTQLESTHQCKLPRALASPEGPCQAVQLRQTSLRLQQCVMCGGQIPPAGSVSEASVTMHVLDMHRCLCVRTGLPANRNVSLSACDCCVEEAYGLVLRDQLYCSHAGLHLLVTFVTHAHLDVRRSVDFLTQLCPCP